MRSLKLPELPRMALWVLISLVLLAAAVFSQAVGVSPGSVLAVSIYKAHLISLGGWAGYWLDRTLYPYARPHELKCQAEDDAGALNGTLVDDGTGNSAMVGMVSWSFDQAMIRRAIITAACIVGMCMGA